LLIAAVDGVYERKLYLLFINSLLYPLERAMSYDGFGRVIFFLELGLVFISGRNDYPVFSKTACL
jgi:hypothetical protein